MTNKERLNQMTDEELARFIARNEEIVCDGCSSKECHIKEDCIPHIIKWLNSDVNKLSKWEVMND